MEMADIQPSSKETAEHYSWGDRCDGWHLVKHPDLSVIQERMPPRTSEVRHFHNRARQFFYILSGKAVMEIDGREIRLVARQGLHIEPRIPHQMKNESDEDVHFLVISQPASHGDREVASR